MRQVTAITSYCALIGLIVLLYLFDDWFDRTALRVSWVHVFPIRWITWGYLIGNDGHFAKRFVIIRIPYLRTWGKTNYGMSEDWIEHTFQWIEGAGFAIHPPLP